MSPSPKKKPYNVQSRYKIEQKAKAKDVEIKSLRGTVRNRSRQLKSIEGALVELAEISDPNGKLLSNQVKIAYQKFVEGELMTRRRSLET